MSANNRDGLVSMREVSSIAFSQLFAAEGLPANWGAHFDWSIEFIHSRPMVDFWENAYSPCLTRLYEVHSATRNQIRIDARLMKATVGSSLSYRADTFGLARAIKSRLRLV
jgi:hypothetical protein